MEEKINKISELSYKNRFSVYYKPNDVLIRIYYPNGNQHKVSGKTLDECLDKMITFLSRNLKYWNK